MKEPGAKSEHGHSEDESQRQEESAFCEMRFPLVFVPG